MAQAVLSVVSGIVGYKAQKDAGDEAKKAAELNAQNIRAETAESVRRTRAAADQQESQGQALAAASGTKVGPGSSSDIVLGELKAENTRQISWLERSGASRSEIARQEGRYRESIHDAQALAALFGGFTDAAGSIDWSE